MAPDTPRQMRFPGTAPVKHGMRKTGIYDTSDTRRFRVTARFSRFRANPEGPTGFEPVPPQTRH
jgi:hypothetical protein